MKRNDWRFLVNTLLFVDICSIAALGLLLAFVIPRGFSGAKNFLGLHRHEWGDFHLYLSLTLLVLVSAHLWLNWKWITQATNKYFGDYWKKALWWLSCAWLPVLIIGWLLMKLS
ncbi:MAG: DUF4405 domain-containing protein [Syntrophobacteria bacterium]